MKPYWQQCNSNFPGARPRAELRGLTWQGKQSNCRHVSGEKLQLYVTYQHCPTSHILAHPRPPVSPLGPQLLFTFKTNHELAPQRSSGLLRFWSQREIPTASLLYRIHTGILLFPPARPSSWVFSTSSTPACYLQKPCPVLQIKGDPHLA